MESEQGGLISLDIARAKRGAQQVFVQGVVTGGRAALLEEAIALIQAGPVSALRERYLGVKNYASFGDQRHDDEYNYGPKHGSIVFKVGRLDRSVGKALDADAVYFLEAVRDAGTFTVREMRGKVVEERLGNLGDLLREYQATAERMAALACQLDAVTVDAHDVALREGQL